MKRIWTAVAAVALVAVFLLLAVPNAGIASGAPAPVVAPSTAGPGALSAPLSGELRSSVLQQASAAAAKAGLTSAQTRAELDRIGAMSPEQLLSLAGLSPAAIHAFANCGPLPGSCSSNAGATLGGCLIGGILGASAGVVGAGIGCAVGAAAALVMFQYGLSQAASQAETAYAQWANAEVSSAWNEVNLTVAGETNLLSALNFSTIAFQRMADNAALFQLGNSSFNIAQDEYQSGLEAQMATVLATYAAQTDAVPTQLLRWFNAQASTGAEFGSLSPVASVGTFMGCPSCTTIPVGIGAGSTNPSSFLAWTTIGLPAAPSSSYVYVPAGTRYIWADNPGSPGATVTVTGYFAPHPTTTYTFAAASGELNETWTLPAGMYWFNASGDSPTFAIAGGAAIPTASSDALGGMGGTSTSTSGPPWGGGAATSVILITDAGMSIGQGSQYSGTYAAATPIVPLLPQSLANMGIALASIEYNAAVNGEVYWSFLQSIGFHSVTQIPPDCLVPAPYQVLPSDLNLGNLTATQLQTLYMAWLQGLGNFYNVSLSGTAFCGTQAPKQFHLGNTTWGDLQVNATGDVYLNNGTSPIALNGKALATELYGNLSSWALTHDQLLLMPTLGTVHIPVGVKWAVPANNPIEIYAVQPGQMFRATGNGSASPATLVPLATVAPGDSLYLTSCVVGGAAQTNCTVTVQTINTTTASLSCGLGATGPGSCQTQPSGGTFGGFPNPFSWLSGLFSGLFGGGPLGSFLSGLAAGIVILIVIAVLVYVAAIEVEAWGGRKKRGDGGGGSTIVVKGGG